ncbi:MAG: hypothetical protein DI562_13465 [Stenotrophomonas acidaminiphila]|nr:MAG: hypothetical protein DI562_13465 [Stenotrophomonas acidaminiphila]
MHEQDLSQGLASDAGPVGGGVRVRQAARRRGPGPHVNAVAAAVLLALGACPDRALALDAVCRDPATGVAVGNASAAGDQVACGQGAVAGGTSAVAIGIDVLAGTSSSVAIGDRAQATGLSATAIGLQAVATGRYSVALGAGADALGELAYAMGNEARANARDVAIGAGALSSSSGSANGSVESDLRRCQCGRHERWRGEYLCRLPGRRRNQRHPQRPCRLQHGSDEPRQLQRGRWQLRLCGGQRQFQRSPGRRRGRARDGQPQRGHRRPCRNAGAARCQRQSGRDDGVVLQPFGQHRQQHASAGRRGGGDRPRQRRRVAAGHGRRRLQPGGRSRRHGVGLRQQCGGDIQRRRRRQHGRCRQQRRRGPQRIGFGQRRHRDRWRRCTGRRGARARCALHRAGLGRHGGRNRQHLGGRQQREYAEHHRDRHGRHGHRDRRHRRRRGNRLQRPCHAVPESRPRHAIHRVQLLGHRHRRPVDGIGLRQPGRGQPVCWLPRRRKARWRSVGVRARPASNPSPSAAATTPPRA